ncbi:hypothetical protein Pmani_036075 [Petrolisthes manimaculis]|uniref:Uncharacterized protein n=1 Tax=Petrolisthes manimaculis TaxID=1843537 RepID=A0AAE1NKC8_9EUCA|nr:hypothetical protein Pmani_036075 [Petrolisthes manimaculis]
MPDGPVPGCVTVSVLPGDPHIRLLAHYHTHLCNKYGTISDAPLITAPRTVSAPELHTTPWASYKSNGSKK